MQLMDPIELEDQAAIELDDQLSNRLAGRMEAIPEEEVAEGLPEKKEVPRPTSSYLIFMEMWKRDHPTQKMSLQMMGELWKSFTPEERIPFETVYRERKRLYDEYTGGKGGKTESLFATHRVKCIMKQDSSFTPKAQACSVMSKVTEHFGEYLLQQIKKANEGKGRIDAKNLYACITNQRVFSFLSCLLEENNKEGRSPIKKNPPPQDSPEQPIPPRQENPPPKKISLPGQAKLTDMFLKKH